MNNIILQVNFKEDAHKSTLFIPLNLVQYYRDDKPGIRTRPLSILKLIKDGLDVKSTIIASNLAMALWEPRNGDSEEISAEDYEKFQNIQWSQVESLEVFETTGLLKSTSPDDFLAIRDSDQYEQVAIEMVAAMTDELRRYGIKSLNMEMLFEEIRKEIEHQDGEESWVLIDNK